MRHLLVLMMIFPVGCASTIQQHGRSAPVSWSLTSGVRADSGEVCRSGDTKPCVLQATTENRPVDATVVVHVTSTAPRRFVGTLEVNFFGHPDPHVVTSKIDLSPNRNDLHSSVTEGVTSVRGTYYVRIRLQETGAGITPHAHEIDIPVQVK